MPIIEMSQEEFKLRRALRDAAIALIKFKPDSRYYAIEDEITEAIMIADGKSLYCDIHG